MKVCRVCHIDCGECNGSTLIYEAAILNCTKCHATCKECSSAAETACTACPSSPVAQFIQLNGTCQPGCATGTFLPLPTSIACIVCSPNCKTCNGPGSSQCTSCHLGKNLQPDNSCGFGCPLFYFPNADSKCVTCHPNCETCSNELINSCTSCNIDRVRTAAGECVKKCSTAFFYFALTDTCAKCHSDCLECNGGSGQDCTVCVAGKFKHVNRYCVGECPAGFFVMNGATCVACPPSCARCTGPRVQDCLSCLEPSVMLKSKACGSQCDAFHYPTPDRVCEDCHLSCSECTGPLDTDCTQCRDKANSRLNARGQCIDCLRSPELDREACDFNVKVELVKPSDRHVNPNASTTLRLTFMNEQRYSTRLTSQHFSGSLVIRVSNFEQKEFKVDFVVREKYFLIDLYFSKSLEQEVKVTAIPTKSVILTNRFTQVSELIFRNDSSNVSLIASKAPDMKLVASLANTVETSAKLSSSTSIISSGLSAIALISSSGFGAPLMKFFKIFKLVSRLRLINIEFGTFLELFLSFCNSVFKIGGDEIGKEALMSSPNTRGKLDKYKVTVLTVEVISLQYAVYWLILLARFFRIKVRRYAPQKKDLSLTDKLTNLVAESGRVLLLTLIGIDVCFYSVHCLSHMDQKNKKSLSGFMSFWLSFVTLIALTVDFILMISDNAKTTFKSLREKFRKESNLRQLLNKKLEIAPTKPGVQDSTSEELDSKNKLNQQTIDASLENQELQTKTIVIKPRPEARANKSNHL